MRHRSRSTDPQALVETGGVLAEIIVRERLQASANVLTSRMASAPTSPSFDSWQRDRKRIGAAMQLLATNGLPLRNGGGWLVWSGARCYRVSAAGVCDCPAGQHGTACKHIELVAHTAPHETPDAEPAREAA